MDEGREFPRKADWQRLAAGMALLTGEPGEAANAGRMMGATARRLGLSGGDLKDIFLAGLAARGGEGAGDLHAHLAAARAEARLAGCERDALRGENRSLKAGLTRLRRRALAALAGGVFVLLAGVLVARGGAWLGDRPVVPDVAAPQPGSLQAALAEGARVAVVRSGGAVLFPAPHRGASDIRLAAGQRVVVRRLVWSDLIQWAEVEVPGGASGYLATTELDLS